MATQWRCETHKAVIKGVPFFVGDERHEDAWELDQSDMYCSGTVSPEGSDELDAELEECDWHEWQLDLDGWHDTDHDLMED
jgi:hypothetical protein